MFLSPTISVIAVLYLVTTSSCDRPRSTTTTHHQHNLNTSKWKTNHTYTTSTHYMPRYHLGGRRQYGPSTVSPWPYVVKKSFGPFTTTTTTTVKPPSVVQQHRLRLVPDDVKVRHTHKSRFPHLDSVVQRLDGYGRVSTVRPRLSGNRLPGEGEEDDVFEDDYDLGDDYLLDAEDSNEDSTSPLDEDTEYLEDDTADDEEDILEDEDEPNRNGKAADGSSRSHQKIGNPKSVVSTATNSPFTAYKWEMYGTKQRVEETRRAHLDKQPQHKSTLTSQSSMNMAVFQHIMRANTETRCRRPLPRVVNVLREHPAPPGGSRPASSYIPHCTVLHRCSEDSGCCPDHDMRCAAKAQTVVYLHFYTSSGNKVVRLPFNNHTECACLPKDSTNPIITNDGNSISEASRPSRSDRIKQLTPASMKKCNCPEEFVASYHESEAEDRCMCDCEDSNADCQRMKKGKEYFSLKDRLCINTSKCGTPLCEYGSYLRDTGRCPKLQEKFDAFARVNVHRN